MRGAEPQEISNRGACAERFVKLIPRVKATLPQPLLGDCPDARQVDKSALDHRWFALNW